MKKLLIILIFLSTIVDSLFAQNAFWDAVILHNAREGVLGQDLKDATEAHPDFFDAPFATAPDTALIRTLYTSLRSRGEETVSLLQAAAISSTSQAQLTTPTPTTLLIDGTARFLAERFREEATTLYLDRFRNSLNNDPIVSHLLPKTNSFLNNGNLFDLKALGTSFKEAFEEDLQNLLINLKGHIESTSTTRSADYYAMVFLLDACDQLSRGTHPVDILQYLDEAYEGKAGFEDYFRTVHLVNLLQFNLRALDLTSEENILYEPDTKDPIWIKFSDLRLLNTPEERKYFLGLVYQQDTAFFRDTLGLDPTTLESQVEDIWGEQILPLLRVFQEIDIITQQRKLTAQEYIPVFDAFVGLLKWGNDNRFFPGGPIVPASQLEVLEKMIDVYQSIQSKSYAQVVTNGSWLIHRLLQANGATDAEVTRVIELVQHYGTFMVDIVNAEDSEDVKDAIKRNVTKFSYLDKRRSPLSFTVMGQPSLLGGTEEVMLGSGQWKEVAAVSCPIGFDLSFNRRKNATNPSSFNPEHSLKGSTIKEPRQSVIGLYIGVVDLTAPFSFRFDGSTTPLPQDITLKQILSPSLSLHYGIANSPITLAVGWQYTPELRTIGTTTESVNRVMFRCSWDIPLIKLGAKR